MTPKAHRQAVTAAVLGGTLLATAGCTAAAEPRPTAPDETTTRPSPTTTGDPMRYRDGEYQAEGWYGSLPSHITVDLTLADDLITDVSITNHASDPTSLDYQEAFAQAIGDIAIGRSIDDADVDIVAGASGTSEGWNAALEEVRDDARSEEQPDAG